MKLQNLSDLLVVKLKALYDIENQLIKALPKMAKKSSDQDLKQGFTDHLEETKEHAKRLEKAFKLLELKPGKTKVEAIRGLVADTEWIIEQDITSESLDAMLIASAAYVEHYEMAGYMSAVRWATMLGNTELATLLRETLKEENAAAEKLTLLAEEKIDAEAMNDSE